MAGMGGLWGDGRIEGMGGLLGWADWGDGRMAGMGGLGGEMGGWLGWADGWDERIIHLFVWGDGGILGLDSHDALC